MLRDLMLSLSRSEEVKSLITSFPVTRDVVKRYVAGEIEVDVLTTTKELTEKGLLVTIDRLGEDVLEPSDADTTVNDYVRLLRGLSESGLASKAEVSVKLSALGLMLDDGFTKALENARRIAAAAHENNTTITLDMEDHTLTDSTLSIARELRKDFPSVGIVLQSYLFRTEADCREFAYPGSRVRLCKGAYKEPDTVAYSAKGDVDLSYVRCMKILIEGGAYPMFATHDPRLIDIAKALTAQAGRSTDSFEFQMLHGVRPDEHVSLADAGFLLRVYVPYGIDWYGYLMRRMAERPQNMMLFLRSLASKK
ncbi:MAG: proline dehydrogenase family protein [Candidatus Nanopelagicales bacterium]